MLNQNIPKSVTDLSRKKEDELNFTTEVIQEIKNLKFYNKGCCVVATIDNLSDILLDGYPNKLIKATYANLQGEYKGLNFTLYMTAISVVTVLSKCYYSKGTLL